MKWPNLCGRVSALDESWTRIVRGAAHVYKSRPNTRQREFELKRLTNAACARLGSIQHALRLASRDDWAASLRKRAKFLPFSPKPDSDDFISVETAKAESTSDGWIAVR